MTIPANERNQPRDSVYAKRRLTKRLDKYWLIERKNIFLLPLAGSILVVVVFKSKLTLAFVLSLVANSWILTVGTIALRMMQQRLYRDASYEAYWLPWLHLAQLPSLLLIIASIVVTVLDSTRVFPSFTASQYLAIGFTLLATLEYVNYYHHQLQHFDNANDFQRLRSGRGFRKSHLARSLQKWRKTRRQIPE